jgi:hypothetical protein
MNGKQAKRLRRAALGLGVTLSEAGKTIEKDGYVVRKHSNNLSPSSIMSNRQPSEGDAPPQAMPSYQLLVRKDSVKGIYKQLKRGA